MDLENWPLDSTWDAFLLKISGCIEGKLWFFHLVFFLAFHSYAAGQKKVMEKLKINKLMSCQINPFLSGEKNIFTSISIWMGCDVVKKIFRYAKNLSIDILAIFVSLWNVEKTWVNKGQRGGTLMKNKLHLNLFLGWHFLAIIK